MQCAETNQELSEITLCSHILPLALNVFNAKTYFHTQVRKNDVLALFAAALAKELFVFLIVRRRVEANNSSIALAASICLYNLWLQWHFMSSKSTSHLCSEKTQICHNFLLLLCPHTVDSEHSCSE